MNAGMSREMQDGRENSGKLGLYPQSITNGRRRGGKLTLFNLGNRDPLSSERGQMQRHLLEGAA